MLASRSLKHFATATKALSLPTTARFSYSTQLALNRPRFDSLSRRGGAAGVMQGTRSFSSSASQPAGNNGFGTSAAKSEGKSGVENGAEGERPLARRSLKRELRRLESPLAGSKYRVKASSPVETKIDIFDFGGKKGPLSKVSDLNFIGIAEGEARLSLFREGFVHLKQTGISECSLFLFTRASSWQHVGASQPKPLGIHSLSSAIIDGRVAQLMVVSSAEGILSLLTDEIFLLGRDAHWRDQPISDRQVAYLSSLIATSLPLDKSSASASTISGEWVGLPQARVPLGGLNAGQASDTLTRVLLGREKLEEQFKEQGKLRPLKQWIGAEGGSKEARQARLKQSKDLDAALSKNYFA